MSKLLKIIEDYTLTYHQKAKALAELAENGDTVSLPRSKEFLTAVV